MLETAPQMFGPRSCACTKIYQASNGFFISDGVPDDPVLCTKINQLGNSGFLRP